MRTISLIVIHCSAVNHNGHSIGVCYEGGHDIRGQPADTRTEAQKASSKRPPSTTAAPMNSTTRKEASM